MIKETEHLLPASRGTGKIYAKFWSVDDPIAVVQIAHDVGEHILRYDVFADFLNDNKIAVCGNDHAGHGRSTLPDERGFFSESNGCVNSILDIYVLNKMTRDKFKDVPIFLFGHGVGSCFARIYSLQHYKTIKGLILSGTCGESTYISKVIEECEKVIYRTNIYERNEKLHKFIYNSYNSRVREKSTEYDWLSSISYEVDSYVDDEMCGLDYTAGLAYDIFLAMTAATDKAWAKQLNKDLPIMIISGSDDPFGRYGEGAKQTYTRLKKAKANDVSMRIYKESRHDILHDACMDTVHDDIFNWIRSTLHNERDYIE